ncbi:MAG: NADH-quinone oxidoreductase subunit H [Victivallaceae bacterium]|nr:NADH-quinone oxidoreductase subunit H [Victivallaceae bacterium]
MEIVKYLISPLLALLLSPLLLGVVNKTKAFFAGRKGAPLLQLYYDLFRLFNKDSVISGTTSQIFKIAPIIVFGAILAAIFLLPFTAACKSFAFTGDFVLLFYLLALARFFMIIAALDTGSAFEGMGASREAFFAALAEPVIFITILTILRLNQSTSLITAFTSTVDKNWIIMALLAFPMFIVMLTENSRIPFDDPNTHLELTMVHEVMILDHSGIDLAILEYAAALKFWLFTLLFVKIIFPFNGAGFGVEMVTTLGLMILSSIAVGVIESVMARSRLVKIPQLLFSAGVIACLGFYLSISKLY